MTINDGIRNQISRDPFVIETVVDEVNSPTYIDPFHKPGEPREKKNPNYHGRYHKVAKPRRAGKPIPLVAVLNVAHKTGSHHPAPHPHHAGSPRFTPGHQDWIDRLLDWIVTHGKRLGPWVQKATRLVVEIAVALAGGLNKFGGAIGEVIGLEIQGMGILLVTVTNALADLIRRMPGAINQLANGGMHAMETAGHAILDLLGRFIQWLDRLSTMPWDPPAKYR